MVKKDEIFDSVLESVGNNGPFQRRFIYLYNFVFAIAAVMPAMNFILALSIPGHWCHVPGREFTNYTIEQWRNLTLPKEVNNKGLEVPSSCAMYNNSDPEHSDELFGLNYSVIECQHGYEYDTTWFDLTIPSQEDWVCDKSLRVTNVFVAGRIGDVIGAIVLGQLGDYIGRKPVFFISIFIMIIGKIMHLFVTKWYYLFILGTMLASMPSMVIYQIVLVIGAEISSSDGNAHVVLTQGLAWSIGVALLPLIYWILPNWFYFILITSLPLLPFIISNRYLIESPRWLANRRKLKECEAVLKQIAKINKTTLNDDALELLQQNRSQPEKLYGMASLFSNWRLAKKTLALLTCGIVSWIAYNLLILNATNMDGNPFINFFYLNIAEIPALFIGKWLTNRFGRKWTAAVGYFLTALFACPLLFTSTDPSLHMYTSAFTVLARFFLCVVFYTITIQGVEIYPTCLRQTGTSMGTIAGNVFGILGPYIVHLGITNDVRYPHVILILLMLTGSLAQLVLPETLYQKLPDTLYEAKVFGQDQKCWEFPKKPAQKLQDNVQMNNIPKEY